jgi:hypothetical protein
MDQWQPGKLHPEPDVGPAKWIVDSLHEFGQDVGSVVPPLFGAYCRVFHPPELRAADGSWHPITWHEVAGRTGATPHREMQFQNISGRWEGVHGEQDDPWPDLSDPEEGSIPTEIVEVLLPILEASTTTPERCYFAVWEGWGDLANEIHSAPTFEIPHRRLHLLEGPLAGATQPLGAQVFRRSANLWWPADQSWCVATEIDFEWTYVGGTKVCVDQIVNHAQLEAMTVDVKDGITWASDKLNPAPPKAR